MDNYCFRKDKGGLNEKNIDDVYINKFMGLRV